MHSFICEQALVYLQSISCHKPFLLKRQIYCLSKNVATESDKIFIQLLVPEFWYVCPWLEPLILGILCPYDFQGKNSGKGPPGGSESDSWESTPCHSPISFSQTSLGTSVQFLQRGGSEVWGICWGEQHLEKPEWVSVPKSIKVVPPWTECGWLSWSIICIYLTSFFEDVFLWEWSWLA